ncbi:MAG: ParA family protein [Desulfuromonadales bacterium]|nr:ParA family protein [Desulfuromonadales bacterium]
MPKTVVCLQQKGGSSKTTLCIHVATMLKHLYPRKKVAVADADPQQSATMWMGKGAIEDIELIQVAQDGDGKQLKKELADINADVVFLDLPPFVESVSLRAALYGNVILVPVGPSELDISAAQRPLDVCNEAVGLDPTKVVLIVPTRVREGTAAGKELRDVLAEMGRVSKATIGMRTAYSDAVSAGVGVNHFAPGTKAYSEIEELTIEIAKELGFGRPK